MLLVDSRCEAPPFRFVLHSSTYWSVDFLPTKSSYGTTAALPHAGYKAQQFLHPYNAHPYAGYKAQQFMHPCNAHPYAGFKTQQFMHPCNALTYAGYEAQPSLPPYTAHHQPIVSSSQLPPTQAYTGESRLSTFAVNS